MITQDEAYKTMMSHARFLGWETVSLEEALGRVLACEEISSDMDMPPFIKSAMDGYACRREDLANTLQVVGTVNAGVVCEVSVERNQCAKIMTGAMVPEGADCVIMVEQCEELDGDAIRFTGESTRDNLCLRGEDIRKGDVVLRTGTCLRPQHIALLASVGCVRPKVARQPRVGIISTGDELVEPTTKPSVSQIRNSNATQLVSHVQSMSAIPTYYGIAKDSLESIDRSLRKAISENDVVLLSGGVSMGDLDFVPDVMMANGLDILFTEIAVQPGKPTTFAVSDGMYCIGLPGNPLATFNQFELLVKPFLHRLMGHDYGHADLRLPMASMRSRKSAVRENWFPVRIVDDGAVMPCEVHGSAHVAAMCQADGLAKMPAGLASLERGDLVRVRML